MAGKPQLSDETKSAILKDLQTGEKYSVISNRYSVSLWTVNEIAKLNGIKRSKGCPTGARIIKHERLIAHYYFTGAHQVDTFLENCF